jgi:hypothetical protein
MIRTAMMSPKPDDPKVLPEASACSGKVLFFHAVPFRPKPASCA